MPRALPTILLVAMAAAVLLAQVPIEMLGRLALCLLAWALGSTLLVALLGGWVAWRRQSAGRGGAPDPAHGRQAASG